MLKLYTIKIFMDICFASMAQVLNTTMSKTKKKTMPLTRGQLYRALLSSIKLWYISVKAF